MTSSRAEWAISGLLTGFAAFQLGLAAGAPWGRASYGGSHHGVLPVRLRRVSAVASVGYVGGAALVLSGRGSPRLRARALGSLQLLMTVGTLANGASRSGPERALWTPTCVATAVLAHRARRRIDPDRG